MSLELPQEREILEKRELATNIYEMVIHAPKVARAAHAGQFILIMVDEKGERIPMTLVDWDSEQGWIKMVYQEVGTSTIKLSLKNAGDQLYYLAGPLGHPSKVSRYGRVVMVGGGVGIPALYPIARELKRLGNHITTIIGAKTSNALIYENEMKQFSDELYVTTDDGSRGIKGYTVDALRMLLDRGERFDASWYIGPALMMKACTEASAGRIPVSYSSLNSLMVCGVGMCGACRITVGGRIALTCVDGPEFDSYQVSWKELAIRLQAYKKEEMISLQMLKGAGRI